MSAVCLQTGHGPRVPFKECNLDGIDGVICIGGDGMFAEIFNGILIRSGLDHNGIDLITDSSAADFLSSKALKRQCYSKLSHALRFLFLSRAFQSIDINTFYHFLITFMYLNLIFRL